MRFQDLSRYIRLSGVIAENRVSSIAVVCDEELMMGQRRDNNLWTIPGGHLEPGESAMAGAVRELREESGIISDNLEYLGSEVVDTFTGKVYLIHSYKLELEKELKGSTKADPDKEVKAWEWVSTRGGLPASILASLHSPKNVTLKLLGLQHW